MGKYGQENLAGEQIKNMFRKCGKKVLSNAETLKLSGKLGNFRKLKSSVIKQGKSSGKLRKIECEIFRDEQMKNQLEMEKRNRET